MKKSKFFFLLLAVFLCVMSSQESLALSIENRSDFTAVVYLKDEGFKLIKKIRIPPKSLHHFLEAGREQEVFQIEAYVLDPADTVGMPTFLHQVKFRDTVCVPMASCLDGNKAVKKKR